MCNLATQLATRVIRYTFTIRQSLCKMCQHHQFGSIYMASKTHGIHSSSSTSDSIYRGWLSRWNNNSRAEAQQHTLFQLTNICARAKHNLRVQMMRISTVRKHKTTNYNCICRAAHGSCFTGFTGNPLPFSVCVAQEYITQTQGAIKSSIERSCVRACVFLRRTCVSE